MIVAVHPDNLRWIWPRILRYIQEPLAYESDGLTPERLYDQIRQQRMLLLVALDKGEILAAQTMEIIETPQGKLINLVTTGGHDLDKWQDELAQAMDNIAKEQGAGSIRTRGRPGWLRQLKRNGYTPLYFIAEKRLNS